MLLCYVTAATEKLCPQPSSRPRRLAQGHLEETELKRFLYNRLLSGFDVFSCTVIPGGLARCPQSLLVPGHLPPFGGTLVGPQQCDQGCDLALGHFSHVASFKDGFFRSMTVRLQTLWRAAQGTAWPYLYAWPRCWGWAARRPDRRSVLPRAPALVALSPLSSMGSACRKSPCQGRGGGMPDARGVRATVPPSEAPSHLALWHG